MSGREVTDRLTSDLSRDLRAFQVLFGEDWRPAMLEYHYGRPEQSRRYLKLQTPAAVAQSRDLIPSIRKIRNYVTADPGALPDLR